MNHSYAVMIAELERAGHTGFRKDTSDGGAADMSSIFELQAQLRDIFRCLRRECPNLSADGALCAMIAVSMRASRAKRLELEARVADLESRVVNFRYCGVWKAGEYRQGNFATHDGSVFHANVDTKSKPGTDATWTLACKRGKDGR
jgi:hypothetical protein